MSKKRVSITIYETDAELELLNKFKHELKQLQTCEHNFIKLEYTNKYQHDFIKVFKTYFDLIKLNKEKLIKNTNQFQSMINKLQ